MRVSSDQVSQAQEWPQDGAGAQVSSNDGDLDFDLNVVARKEVLRQSNVREDHRDVKTTRKLSRRKKEAENSDPMSLIMIEGDEVRNMMSYGRLELVYELGSEGNGSCF